MKITPTQAANLWAIRQYGPWGIIVGHDLKARKAIIRAYVAGVRHGRNERKHRVKCVQP